MNLTEELRDAAKRGYTKKVERLIQEGADVNTRDKDYWTALMFAAMYGRTKMAELLIEKGADIDAKDKDGWTAFMLAATNANKKIAELLIRKGVDVVYAFINGYGYTRETINQLIRKKPELFTKEQKFIFEMYSNPEKISKDKKKKVIEILREFQKKGSITKIESLSLFTNLQRVWNEQTELRADKKMRKPEKTDKNKLRRMVD